MSSGGDAVILQPQMDCTPVVLVLASTGWLRESLSALLTSIPAVQEVLLANTPSRAYHLVEKLSPAVFLFEVGGANGEKWEVIQQIKRRSPETACMVLIEDVLQEQVAILHGADAVLLQGLPPKELISVIERLMQGA